MSGSQTMEHVSKFAEVCRGGKTLNDPDVKSLQCSDALKSFLIADSMSETLKKDMARQKGRIKWAESTEAEERLNELKLYHSSIKKAAAKAKSVLLAAHGVNTVEQAIIREASKLAISQRTYIDAPAALVGVKRDKPMSFEKANNGAANPHYNSDITATLKGEVFKPYRVNCQTCVLAHEMRLRGYDVEAQPNYQDGSNGCLALSYDTLGLWRNKTTGALPDVTPLHNVFNLDDSVPYGARYVMRWSWKNRDSGHIVTVGHDQSGVYIYDPQTGRRFTTQEYHAARGGSMKNISTWRVDDCEFDDKVANSVLTKPNQPPIKK